MTKSTTDKWLDAIAEFAAANKTRRRTRPVRSAWLDRLSQSQGQR